MNIATNLQVFEGDLWIHSNDPSHSKILRPDFARTFRTIETGPQLCATLRAGQWAWPGGYEIVFFTQDGALLCHKCVKENLYQVIHSIRSNCDDGWLIVGADIVYESGTCDQCSKCVATYCTEPCCEESKS